MDLYNQFDPQYVNIMALVISSSEGSKDTESNITWPTLKSPDNDHDLVVSNLDMDKVNYHYIKKNPSKQELEEKLEELHEIAKKHFEETSKHLAVFVYYSGHGFMKNVGHSQNTHMVLKEAKYFDIEHYMDRLNCHNGVSVFALLDCSRIIKAGAPTPLEHQLNQSDQCEDPLGVK